MPTRKPATLDPQTAATLLGVKPASVRRVLHRHGVTGRVDERGVTRYPAAAVRAAVAARPGPGNHATGPARAGGVKPPLGWTTDGPTPDPALDTRLPAPAPLPVLRGLTRAVFDRVADGQVAAADPIERHHWEVPGGHSTPVRLSNAVDRLVEQGLALVLGRGRSARVLLTWDGERLACHHERKARAAGATPARGTAQDAADLLAQSGLRLDSAARVLPRAAATGARDITSLHTLGVLTGLADWLGQAIVPRLGPIESDLRWHVPGEPVREGRAEDLERLRLALRVCELQALSGNAGRAARLALAEVGNELRRAYRLVLDLS